MRAWGLVPAPPPPPPRHLPELVEDPARSSSTSVPLAGPVAEPRLYGIYSDVTQRSLDRRGKLGGHCLLYVGARGPVAEEPWPAIVYATSCWIDELIIILGRASTDYRLLLS